MRVGWVEKVVAVTMWVENSFSFFKILQRGKVETVMLHRLAQVVLAYLIIPGCRRVFFWEIGFRQKYILLKLSVRPWRGDYSIVLIYDLM